MQHVIYSGTGTYDTHTYEVDYLVYLPALTTGTYEFITNKIFNMSCSQYPNTILMFMKVVNGSNAGFTGCTEEPGTSVTFSISPSSLLSVDPNCTPLNYNKLIYVIIMHDDTLDLPYAKEACYCKAPVITTCPKHPPTKTNEIPAERIDGIYGTPQFKRYGKAVPRNLGGN